MKNKFYKKILKGLSVLSCVLMLGACSINAQNIDEEHEISDGDVFYIDDIKVTVDYIPEENIGRPGEEREIKWLVIHETGNTREGADASAHNEYLQNETDETEISWHYTVDDSEIYIHLPDNENAYHAGDKMVDGGGNKNGIGVELCVNEDGDFEQTLENGAKLFAYLLHKHDLTIFDVKTHQDFSGKLCPETLIETGRLDEFKDMIRAEYIAMSDEEFDEELMIEASNPE